MIENTRLRPSLPVTGTRVLRTQGCPPKGVRYAGKSRANLMRPDFVGVCLVGVDVDHPAEDLLDPAAAGLGAGVLGDDGAGEAEFFRAALLRGRAPGRQAEVDVLVPARHAERNAFVQLLLGGAFRSGEHRALELVAVLRFRVEQRSGMRGIENESRDERVVIIREVILLLRHFGMKNLEAVGQRNMIVEVLF